MAPSILTPTHRYGAGGLFALALHQAQIHQTRPLGLSSFPEEDEPIEDRCSSSSNDSVSDDPDLWIHQDSGLLRPILRFLEIEKTAWLGLEETCGSPLANHHIGAFLRLLAEENDEPSSERMEQEYALSKAIDAMVISLEDPDIPSEPFSRDGKSSTCERQSPSKAAETQTKVFPETSSNTSSIKEGTTSSNASSIKEEATSSNISSMKEEVTSSNTSSIEVTSSNTSSIKVEATDLSDNKFVEEPIEEIMLLNYQRKVTVLHELISACLANIPEDEKKRSRQKKGYDARHRVALRLLATWLDVKWIKVEAIEVMVAFSAMALMKAEEEKEGSKPAQGKWSKFKRGGIIGAAALTGGALLALTGGLAAPAIAAGFGALAPTLGTLIPVIGAGGFAAIATAAGSVAGSVAVAASFGAAGAGLTGAKMARRTGSVDEFEFIAIGKNHNQGRLGVGILISGMAFEKEDFVRPWEQLKDNLERYAVQWESKNLIAVSTAIQDWLTSRLAMELMRQGAMMTVLSTLLAAFAWPATLLAATEFIDSKWTIAIDRSNKAGKLLAEALSKGLQGHRPVTLVGFSLGARVIFKCLQHLAEMQEAGIVERVVLLGAPISIKDENWGAARKTVAGRFVNVYSTSDWNLGVAFRASLLTKGLAGIQPVGIPGIENVDVTDMIEGHSSYLWTTGKILEQLEMDTYYPVFRRSNAEPQKEDVKEEKA